MKLNSKTWPFFILFFLLGTLIGSLFWEVLERVLAALGRDFSLTMKEPIRIFDFYVLSLSFRANPGSILGAVLGIVLFKVV